MKAMKGKRNCLVLLCMIALLLLGACTKNEFTVSVAQSEGFSPVDLQLVYYASDKEKGWMMTQDIPASLFGQNPVRCITRKPAVVFVYSSSGRLLTVFYAERGDKITLRCQNSLWSATGNDLTDDLARWQRQHSNILLADASTDINKAVAAYVRQHPDEKLSALLLYVYVNAAKDPVQYSELEKLLKGDAEDEDLKRALGRLPDNGAVAEKVPAITLRSRGDSVTTIRPSDANATIFLFWYNSDKRSSAMRELRQKLRGKSNFRLVDVNMQADTMNWGMALAGDSIKPAACLWAPGAEQNSALKDLALPSPDCLLTTDRSGKLLYAGSDPAKAAASIH